MTQQRVVVGVDWRTKPNLWGAVKWIAKGFLHRHPLDKASGLAFDTAFAAVPFLVLVVAILDLTGLYSPLRQEVLDPWIGTVFGEQTGEGQASLATALRQLLATVDGADLGALGWTGLPILLYAVVLVFSAMETAMNDVFDADRHRTWERRLRDYFGLFLLLPIAAGVLTLIAAVLHKLHVDEAFPSELLHPIAVVLGTLGCAGLYKGVANAPVPWRSALVGGLVAAILGYATFLVELQAQVIVARYDALYAGLAAVPLFLLWVFSSWLMILLGAEVAAYLTDWQNYGYRLGEPWPGSRLMEGVAAAAVEAVAAAEVAGRPPPRLRTLARRLGVPRAMLEKALDPLRRGKLVRVVGRDQRPRVALIRGARDTSVQEVLDTIRGAEVKTEKLDELQQASSGDADCTLADVITGKGNL
jgi:membrane protein